MSEKNAMLYDGGGGGKRHLDRTSCKNITKKDLAQLRSYS